MDSNAAFKRNAKQLQRVLKLKAANIATLARSKGHNLTKVYVGAVLNVDKVTNITLAKLDAFAEVFGQRPMDLLNPLGFDDNGQVKGAAGGLNNQWLEQSIIEVEQLMLEANLSDSAIKARAIALIYDHKTHGDEQSLNLLLQQLRLQFGVQ